MRKIIFWCAMAFCLIGCLSKKQDSKKEYRTDQFEVNLADKMDPKLFARNFEKYGLELKCILDEQQNLCIFAFDDTKFDIESIVDYFSKEVGVQACALTKGCESG